MDLVVVLPLFLCLGRVLDGSTNVDQRSRSAREGWLHVRLKRETNSVKGSFHVSPEHVYLQTNQNHSIPCLSWAGEELLFTFWNKGDLELARSVPADVGEDYILNDRYGISDDHALVVRNVQKDDQGVYICKVVFKTGHQKANSITVTVLDTLFPATNGDLVANASLFLERGQRHELRCPILAMETAAGSYTIYWSEDIGDSKFTRIIGARYSDGETKVMDNYNGDYDVKEGDLVAKSFNKLSTRLWCHLFREGSPWMLSGYIGVTGKVTSEERCPSISQCESCEECAVKVEDKHLRLNCSVENIYPELDELSWSVAECDTPVTFSTESHLMYNQTTETFIQKEELRINRPTNASINCTLKCVASGLPIINSTIVASVFVTDAISKFVPPTDVCSPAIIVGVVIPVLVLVTVCLSLTLRVYCRPNGCVICPERHGGHSQRGRSVQVECDGEMQPLNVGENPLRQTEVDEEKESLVEQHPSSSASTENDPTPDCTDDSVSPKAGLSSSGHPSQMTSLREEHQHYTVYNVIVRAVFTAISPRKKGSATKPAKKRTAKRKETSAPATPPPDDFPKDDEAETPSKQLEMQQRKAPISLPEGDEQRVVIEMEGKDSVISDEIDSAKVPLPHDGDWGEEPKTGKQRQNLRDNGPKRDKLYMNETVVEEKADTEVLDPELQKEDDYITKIDDEQETSIIYLETQRLLETANNLKKEAEEIDRVLPASDEEESEPLLPEDGNDAILPSLDISDEQVQDTDQSEKLLLQATLSDVNSNEEGTTQEEVPSTVQTNPEMTDTECKSPVETSAVPPGDESESDEPSSLTTSHLVPADADAIRSFTSTPPAGPPNHGTETPISTGQSPTIERSDPVAPVESHGSSGDDLAVTAGPNPTPPCEGPSLDSAAGHPQPSLENSHDDPSPYQSPSAIANPLGSDDEEMESDHNDDIADDVNTENQTSDHNSVAGHGSTNESPEPLVQDTPATNYDQERGYPRKEKTKTKKGRNKPYSRPEKSTASAQHDNQLCKNAATVQDRSEQCGQDMEAHANEVGTRSTDAPEEVAMDSSDVDTHPLLKEKTTGIRESQNADHSEQCGQDMEADVEEVRSKNTDAPAAVAIPSDEAAGPLLKEKATGIRESQNADLSEQCGQDMEADVDEVGSKSTDAPAEVAMDSSDVDARPLLKEETGIRESQRIKKLKAANPLKTENKLKERDAHRSKPPSNVHH